MNSHLILGMAVAILILFSVTAAGHDTWAVPDSGRVDVGDTVSLAVGSSHAWEESEEIPEGYLIAVMSDRDGNRETRTGTDATIRGLYRVFDFPVRNTGLYVFTLYHTEGSWTHIVTNPPDTDGGIWLNKNLDDIDLFSLDRTGWSDSWYVEQSYPKHCYFKTFLASGATNFSRANLPVQTSFELVPVTDIREAGRGDFVVRVLYKGAPFSGALVRASVIGQESILEARTGSDGLAVLPLNRSGTWIIKSDTGTDPRIVSSRDLVQGYNSHQKTPVGPVYRYTMVLRPDYEEPLSSGSPAPPLPATQS